MQKQAIQHESVLNATNLSQHQVHQCFLSISSSYHDWNAFLTECLNVSFPESSNGCNSSVQDAGTNRTLISFSDSLFMKDSHWWALKTSNMHSACAFDLFSGKSSRIPSMYGSKILSTYSYIVTSFDQWFSECVMCHFLENGNIGWHFNVLPW